MAVVYRAVWDTSAPADSSSALLQFEQTVETWAQSNSATGRAVTSLRRDDGIPGVDITCVDPPSSNGSLWTTVVRTAIDGATQRFVVESHVESEDVTLQISVGRPRVVDDLMSGTDKLWLGPSAVLRELVDVPATAIDALLESLNSDDRTLPYIVFSEPSAAFMYDWRGLAEKTARRAAGIANVVTLDSAAVTAFKNALGELAVWGGGVRTYLPVALADSLSYQHRYIPVRHILNVSSNRIVDRLVYAVAQLSTRRRLPDVFSKPAGSEPALDLTDELERQLQLVEHLEHQLALEREDAEQSQRELARSQGHLARLRDWFSERSQLDVYYGAMSTTSTGMPDEVEAVSEAFIAGQAYLAADLAIPDSAGVDHLRLDTAPNAVAWGNTTWRGLRSLAAYVRDKRDGAVGDFWTWCEAGRPESWPATKKKLAMVESESVDNSKSNSKFKQARMFEVDTRVDPSGRTYMESHLKIAEGGGDLAPRVYFLDDTAGSTGMVHIGFVGPHDLVPNTKS